MPTAILFSPDLFVASQVGAQLPPDWSLDQVARAEELASRAMEQQAKMLLVDLGGIPTLDWDGITAVRDRCPELKLIAFGPHVQAVKLAEAEAAGCDLVLTRGQMLKEGARRLAALGWDETP